eukprot:gene7204-9832_t
MDKYLVPKSNANNLNDIQKQKDLSIDRTLHEANRVIFNNESFRSKQLEIIKNIVSDKDVFVIMPTGGGKSLCYALPAIMSKGVTVVISPLISLIEDQVSSFLSLANGGIPSAYITSTSTAKMISSVYEDLARCRQGLEPFTKLLYVTPERIVKSLETREVLHELYMNEMLARFVIDEAHCVSSWGHDFRKDYGKLGILKADFPEVPIIALTATARKKVADDTLKILNIEKCIKFNTGYDRPNLYFEVRQKPNKGETFAHVLSYIQATFPNDTGIIYCMTKKDCEETSDFLRENKISADYYHAGQTKTDRKMVQHAWLIGSVKVVCATIAYGMGIDKPNVRYVIHLSIAKSIEGYYQEAGRAGRDGNYSECIMYYREYDVSALERLMIKPPARCLNARDRDRLEEMQEYCVAVNECRRKIFADKFGDNSMKFDRCKDKCDNCNSSRGIARRKHEDSTQPLSNKNMITKPTLMKASEMMKQNKSNNNSNNNNAINQSFKNSMNVNRDGPDEIIDLVDNEEEEEHYSHHSINNSNMRFGNNNNNINNINNLNYGQNHNNKLVGNINSSSHGIIASKNDNNIDNYSNNNYFASNIPDEDDFDALKAYHENNPHNTSKVLNKAKKSSGFQSSSRMHGNNDKQIRSHNNGNTNIKEISAYYNSDNNNTTNNSNNNNYNNNNDYDNYDPNMIIMRGSNNKQWKSVMKRGLPNDGDEVDELPHKNTNSFNKLLHKPDFNAMYTNLRNFNM